MEFPLAPIICPFLLLHVLASGTTILVAAADGASSDATSSGGEATQCRGICTACQSMRPARINQICSVNLLSGCSCPEYALNLVNATTTLTALPPASTNPAQAERRNCPVTEAASRVGFCPFGQRTDTNGCPIGVCRPAPGCQTQGANSRLLKDCRAYCPAGYQTDASGCPICRCRCGDGEDDGTDDGTGRNRLERRCATECAAVGAAGHELRAPATPELGCPICLCRVQAAPVTAAGTHHGAGGLPPPLLQTPSPVPAPPPALQSSCLLRCPNSCGQHGYADAESRDERGCVRDCSCRCPPRQGCPNSDRCLRWEIDRFGCQVCSTCSSASGKLPDVTCVTKAQLDSASGSQQSTLIGSFCPAVCPQGSAYFISAAAGETACLTCGCQTVKPPQPPAAAAAAVPACPSLSLEGCLADCPTGINATVARNADGCYACRCQKLATAEQPLETKARTLSCPFEFSFASRCVRSCGPHGFETDPATGCQRSCKCNCPRRNSGDRGGILSGGGCGCFYGSRQDEFGCDTCECITASEYLAFLPF